MSDKNVAQLTSSTPTIDDLTISYDNADTSELKKTTWQLVRDLFKTYFDTIYQAVLVSGTNIKTINGSTILGSGDLVVSGGASTLDSLTDVVIATPTTGQALVYDGTQWENTTLPGGGDALTTNPLSQFASTTSLQLKNTISDETGSGSLVFATSPTLVTPVLGAATATSINGATITSGTLNGSVTGTNTGDQTSIVGITGTKAQFDTAVTDGNIVYSGDSPTLATITTTGNIELGNASDTTISRVSAGVIAVEGKTIPFSLLPSTATDGATVTFDLSTNNKHQVTIAGNRTLALSNTTNIPAFMINIKQDATGSRTVTWFSGITWAGGSAPTLTTTASKTDSFGFQQISAGVYLGFVIAQNI